MALFMNMLNRPHNRSNEANFARRAVEQGPLWVAFSQVGVFFKLPFMASCRTIKASSIHIVGVSLSPYNGKPLIVRLRIWNLYMTFCYYIYHTKLPSCIINLEQSIKENSWTSRFTSWKCSLFYQIPGQFPPSPQQSRPKYWGDPSNWHIE